jgi:hypothetical protein
MCFGDRFLVLRRFSGNRYHAPRNTNNNVDPCPTRPHSVGMQSGEVTVRVRIKKEHLHKLRKQRRAMRVDRAGLVAAVFEQAVKERCDQLRLDRVAMIVVRCERLIVHTMRKRLCTRDAAMAFLCSFIEKPEGERAREWCLSDEYPEPRCRVNIPRKTEAERARGRYASRGEACAEFMRKEFEVHGPILRSRDFNKKVRSSGFEKRAIQLGKRKAGVVSFPVGKEWFVKRVGA